MRRTQSWKSSGATRVGDLLDRFLTGLDFKRRGRQAVWVRGSGDDYVVTWVQLDGRPDPYAGDRFHIAFERTNSPKPAKKLGGRVRLDQLLGRAELDQLLRTQNRIVAGLPKPAPAHVAAFPEDLQRRYLSWFEEAEYAPGFECRFRTDADLQAWANVLADLLPPAAQRAAELIEPHRLYYQRENLVMEAATGGE